jgi:hypothetical protein
MFLPKANWDRISYRSGPGPGENALIVDCELKLQVLAAIVRIEVQRLDTPAEANVLLAVAFDRPFASA